MTEYILHAQIPDPDVAEALWLTIYGVDIPDGKQEFSWLSFPLGGADDESMLSCLWSIWEELKKNTTYSYEGKQVVSNAVEVPILVTRGTTAIYSERIG